MKAEGRLAEEVGRITTLQTLNMQQNKLGGPLPAAWSAPGALPYLLNLVLANNELTGVGGWGGGGGGGGGGPADLGGQRDAQDAAGYPVLCALAAQPAPCRAPPLPAGSVPDEWTGPDTFPSLSLLAVGFNRLTGTLSQDLGFPSLLIL